VKQRYASGQHRQRDLDRDSQHAALQRSASPTPRSSPEPAARARELTTTKAAKLTRRGFMGFGTRPEAQGPKAGPRSRFSLTDFYRSRGELGSDAPKALPHFAMRHGLPDAAEHGTLIGTPELVLEKKGKR
jgi:hypothetical protein